MDAAAFFDAIARRYDRVYAPSGAAARNRLLTSIARLPPASRVLDLGVGTGRALSALLDAGHAPTGLDVSAEMLAQCARRARPVPLVQADFWQPLPFEDRAFDGALALHGTLAHPPHESSLPQLVAELGRVLRPGGVFVAEVPAPAWLDALDALPAEADAPFAIRRSGVASCTHEDRVARVSISGVALSRERWESIFAPRFDVQVGPLGPYEFAIVGCVRAG
jgi:SAM-dependent methyltransferase